MINDLIKRIEFLEAKLAEVCAERDLYKAKFEKAEEENKRLRAIIRDFQRHRFGSKSERYLDAEQPVQGDLFAELFDSEELQ